MESQISLALAEKLRKIFENEDTFLTFPQGMGFTYRYLGFMKDPAQSGLSLQEQLANKADFARLLNIVPADSPAFSNDASRPLWSRTIDVLNAAVFAESALSAEEEARLAKAIDFLTDNITAEDGSEIPVNSEFVKRYYEYRTLYDQAQATYLDEKITVESATGPEAAALKQRWQAYREQQLREAMNLAQQNWQNLGAAEQVRSAQQVRNELEPKKYLNLYRSAYLNDLQISELPDLNGMGLAVYPTFFSPFDAFEVSLPWNKLTLTRAELATLVASASPALRALFGGDTNVDDFESVTLEYTNVAVIRPWHRPEFLTSRYWKTSDGVTVSDGGTPRQGLIPAYITSMLVTRNVTVTRKQARATTAPPFALPLLKAAPLATLKAAQLSASPALSVKAATAAPAAVAVKRAAAPAAQIKAAQLGVATVRAMPLQAAGPVTPAARVAAVPQKTSFVSTKLMATELSPQRALTSQAKALQATYLSAKYVGNVIKAQPCLPPPPREAAPALVTERYGFDGVIVLALVCKRVGCSPNPDKTLRW